MQYLEFDMMEAGLINVDIECNPLQRTDCRYYSTFGKRRRCSQNMYVDGQVLKQRMQKRIE